ncbi:helix-turn-helix transcriptional regulator [Cobetia amphilecti]|uniref:helix-turn-helix transcriptional regulator n=1 Tax=Cobetia amphilecti TaxID=1055104 RepID=UPI0026E32111|nr:AlpA family transcriptional regulator [Cobetia amphilecti]MDO6815334.1 AlpA family transcriptional regulator [Cobetia amphilecti]
MKDSTTLLRRNEVLQRCAFSCSTLRRLQNSGDFPRPIQLGARAVAWVEADIEAWIQQRIKSSQQEGGEQ